MHLPQRDRHPFIEMLPGWTERSRRLLGQAAEIVTYAPGDVLMHEGALPEEFLLLVAGRAELFVADAAVGVVAEGEHLGAAALLTGGRYDSTAVSSQACEALLLGVRQFFGLLSTAPEFGRMLAESFAAQLRRGIAAGARIPVQGQPRRLAVVDDFVGCVTPRVSSSWGSAAAAKDPRLRAAAARPVAVTEQGSDPIEGMGE